MTPRNQRRLRKRLVAQIESEKIARANGATLDDIIPGDIAERMTKPKAPTMLYQVMVEQRKTGRPVAVGPAWSEASAGALAEAIRKMILAGKERDWGNPVIVPVFAGQRPTLNASELLAHL